MQLLWPWRNRRFWCFVRNFFNEAQCSPLLVKNVANKDKITVSALRKWLFNFLTLFEKITKFMLI